MRGNFKAACLFPREGGRQTESGNPRLLSSGEYSIIMRCVSARGYFSTNSSYEFLHFGTKLSAVLLCVQESTFELTNLFVERNLSV